METKTIEIPVEFKELFSDWWREAAIYGGRFSLKSHTVARYLIIQARLKKTRVACFREFQSSIAESSYQLLADLIKLYELNDFTLTNNSIINTINGSDFIFKGLWNNEQSIKSIEGIDIAWVEEAQTVTKNSLEILTPTVRKPNSKIVYTYNRLFEDDPVHTRLVVEGRPNTLVINVNYDVAEKYGYLPKEVKQEIEDDKVKRPGLYRHKWLGEPGSLEARIFKDWAVIDEIPHEARLVRRGIDLGYSADPTAIVDIYQYNEGYIFDEVAFQKGLLNNQIASIVKNQDIQVPVVPDPYEVKSGDELKAFGLTILQAARGRDAIRKQIAFVQAQRCSITRRSINIKKEYSNYCWLTDKDGKVINEPDHTWSHSMSAIYYAMDTLRPKETEVIQIQTRMFQRNIANRQLNSTK